MTVEKMTVEKMTVEQMTVEQMTVEQMTVEQMTVEQMTVNQMTMIGSDLNFKNATGKQQHHTNFLNTRIEMEIVKNIKFGKK